MSENLILTSLQLVFSDVREAVKRLPVLYYNVIIFVALLRPLGFYVYCYDKSCHGPDSEGFWGQWKPPSSQNFILMYKFWINLINLIYRIYPKYFHPFNKSILQPVSTCMCKIAECTVASDLGIHYLLRSVCLSEYIE